MSNPLNNKSFPSNFRLDIEDPNSTASVENLLGVNLY